MFPGAGTPEEAGLVVGEGDVEDPRQAVLDRPVLAHRLGGFRCGEGAGCDEVARLDAGGAPALNAASA